MNSMRRVAFANMRRVAFALLASGCYDAMPPQGAPCDPNAPSCPQGQSCMLVGGAYVCSAADGTLPDAREPDADPGSLDDDGDGVANAVDNCRAHANASQANDDADAVGDACDPCPIATDNTDGDGDGVGDACDPNPAVAGDELVMFEGFDAGIPSAWAMTGSWTTSVGSLSSSVSGSTQNTLVTDVLSSPRQTIYARMTLTGIVAGQSGGALGIVDRFDNNASVGIMCGGARGAGGYLALVNAANGQAIDAKAHAFAIGTTFDLVFSRNDNNYRCSDESAAQTVSANASPSGSLIGFRNRVASASFAWIMVVRSP